MVSLTVLALISTTVALKAQFIILAPIAISLVSVFLGTTEYVPETVNLFFVFALSFALFSTVFELTAKEIGEGDSRALNYQISTSAGKLKFKAGYSRSFGMKTINGLIPIV